VWAEVVNVVTCHPHTYHLCVALQARRNWTASLRGVFLRPRPRAPPAATAFALSQVMGTATNTGVGSYGNLEHPDGHHGAANNNNRVTLAAANSHPNFGNVTFPPAYTAAHSGGGVMLRPVAVRADGGMLANMSLAEDSKEDEDSRGPSTRPSTEVPNQNGVRSVSRSFRVASLAPVLSSSVRQAAGDATKAENVSRSPSVRPHRLFYLVVYFISVPHLLLHELHDERLGF